MILDDDRIDDLVRGFRADEGDLDEARRARITAMVEGATADIDHAGAAVFVLDRAARRPRCASHAEGRARHDDVVVVAPSEPRRGRPSGGLLVAAAAVVLVAVAGVAVVRADLAAEDRRADGGEVVVAPGLAPGLDELAAAAEKLPPGPVLGDPGSAYAYRAVTVTAHDVVSGEVTVTRRTQWVALDGTGRNVPIGPSGPADGPDRGGDETEPDTIRLGALPPRAALALPADAAGVAAVVSAHNDGGTPVDNAARLVDTLASAGLPPTARAGLLRLLHQIGYRPTGPVAADSPLACYEGPWFGGATVAFTIDTDTLVVRSLVRPGDDGQIRTFEFDEVRLRDDLGH